jgi:hypothetical protein
MNERGRHVPFIKGQQGGRCLPRLCRSFVCDPFHRHTNERDREREREVEGPRVQRDRWARSEGNSKTRRLQCNTRYS